MCENKEWCALQHLKKETKAHYIYYDSKLLAPVVYFVEPVKTSLWAVWAEYHGQYIGFLPQTNQEGQLISKCLFGVFDSPKKRTKTAFCKRNLAIDVKQTNNSVPA